MVFFSLDMYPKLAYDCFAANYMPKNLLALKPYLKHTNR